MISKFTPEHLLIYEQNDTERLIHDNIYGQNFSINSNNKFGVEIIREDNSDIVCVKYYSKESELHKKVIYNSLGIISIDYLEHGKLFCQEIFKNGLLKTKLTYNQYGEISSTLDFQYDDQGLIISIKKCNKHEDYEINYNYDSLQRVISRIFKVKNVIYYNQMYKYDILDRIVEYSDLNQKIIINRVNSRNDLVEYKLIDKNNKVTVVHNKFLCTEYIGTEIIVDGLKSILKDPVFVKNQNLVKPIEGEKDLELVIQRYISDSQKNENGVLKLYRHSDTDVSNLMIKNSVAQIDVNILPITRRKLQLLKRA